MAVGRVKDTPGRQYTVMGPGPPFPPERLLLDSFSTFFATLSVCLRCLLSADRAKPPFSVALYADTTSRTFDETQPRQQS